MGFNDVDMHLSNSEKETISSENSTAKRIKTIFNFYVNRISNRLNSVIDQVDAKNRSIDTFIDNNGYERVLKFTKEDFIKEMKLGNKDDYFSFGSINNNARFNHGAKSWPKFSVSHSEIIPSIKYGSSNGLKILQYAGGVENIVYPIDRSKSYRAVIVADASLSDGTFNPDYYCKHFFGVACFDIDGHFISVGTLTKRHNSLSLLVNDVNKGDYDIVLEGDSSKWYVGTANHARSLTAYKLRDDGTYGYIGDNGKYYKEMGYSRYHMYNAYERDQITDNGDGTFTIHLRYGLTFSAKAGDKFVNSYYGGTYNYWLSWKTIKADGKKTVLKSNWRKDSLDLDPTHYWGNFREGTAFIKVMGLFQYRTYDPDGNSISNDSIHTNIYKLGLEVKNN